jgi:beta-glucanase (GH16 family)
MNSSSLRTTRTLLGTLLLAAVALVAPAEAQYQLVWEDNFNGSSLDLGKWQHEIGTGSGGWGNNELQYYRSQNTTVSGGMLTITAKQENFAGSQYTSSRLRTKNQGDWEYGRIEMRAKLPTGQGMWPAFWMLPTDWVHGGWAASGEIDIMEMIGSSPATIHGTLHYGDSWPDNVSSGSSYTLPSGSFNDAFHVFAIEWDEFEMRWYVDGIHYATQTSWWSTGGAYPAPFNERFHLLLNLAVGGNWPGSPNGSTSFPQEFVVDYVRVYQEGVAPIGCVSVFDDMDHGDPFGNGYFTFSGIASGGIGGDVFNVPPGVGGFASLDVGWGSGGTPGFFGGFGTTNPLDLTDATHFEFWIDPNGGQDYFIEVNLQDDDNGDNSIPGVPDGADDEFQYSLHVSPTGPGAISGGGWQKVSIPLSSFSDDNSFHTGGNGVFDPTSTGLGGNGRLVNVVFALVSNSGADVSFRTDHWTFTNAEGSVSGRVWADTDGNGFPAGEPGLNGVTVEAFDTNAGAVVATDVTSGDGNYLLDELPGGALEVRVVPATLPTGAAATFDPDGVATLDSCVINLLCDEAALFQDFGYEPAAPTNYCIAAANSVSPTGAQISSTGSTSILANNLGVSASPIPAGEFGVFFHGANIGMVPFGEGFLCAPGGIVRIWPPSAANGTGALTRAFDNTGPAGLGVLVSATRRFQCWYRDPAGGPNGFNLSDALSVTFWP